ncbi:cytolytic toxin-alpha-like [Tachysurus vachellii]|uniref:cytolytic toxin-alpha-like n=1 Tax=Tachysurus vachellii TaxID=175792 RepID=UPI00296B035D|nr:cytolytic toxin-alpha-like [Tachysurus vachellii]
MSSKIIEIPALGRPLHPGTLYDCRSDNFIPGITLWDKETLRNKVSSRRQPKTELNFSASDTLNDKSKLLNVNASLKASILGGLVDVAGSARYICDNKSSSNQSRISLQYSHTTKFEQLTMSQLRNTIYPKVFEDGTATHVVASVLYGGQAFMLFEIAADENEDKEEIEGNLNVMVRKIPSLSVEGGGALKMNDNEKKLSNSIKCTFYGDFELELNPTTYLEALHVYKTLPSLLRERENDAVPVKVWLYPLSLLNEKAAIVQREIQKTLITKASAVLEELGNAEILCNDLLTSTKVNDFPDVKLRMKTFQNLLADYKMMFLKAMRKLIPAIRGGTKEEQALADIVKIHHKSPFRAEKLNDWLEYNQSEQNLLALYTQQVSGVPVVKSSVLYSTIIIDPSIDIVVCFCFNSLTNEDPYLSMLTKFLKVDEFENLSTIPESADSEVFQGWFQNRDVMEKTKDNHSLFRSFFQANKDEVQTKFVIVSISDLSNLGTCIHLYRKGKLVDRMFQPVSKPPAPTFEIENNDLILKLQKSPTGSTIRFRVEYRIMQATESKDDDLKWETIETPDAQETFKVPNFDHASSFCFRYRAISEVGVSEVSNPTLYSPKGIFKFSLGQTWTLPFVGAVNMSVGMAFYLQGVVSEKLGSIICELKTGPGKYDDTAFQLLLRPNEYFDFSSVVFNIVLRTGEETTDDAPFLLKTTLKVVGFNSFSKGKWQKPQIEDMVIINGLGFSRFKERIPTSQATLIQISGDVFMNTCGIIQV